LLYCLIFTFVFLSLNLTTVQRFGWSLASVAAISLMIPLVFNFFIEGKTETLTKEDRKIEKPLKPGNTILLNIPDSYGVRGNQDNKCQALCQKLLFNGMYDSVIVHFNNWKYRYKFTIEKRKRCPAVKGVIDTVAMRIASGECLIRTQTFSDKPDIVYKKHTILSPSQYTSLYAKAAYIFALRVQVIDTSSVPETILHQVTQVKSKPLSYPFLLGPMGGRDLKFKIGAFRTTRSHNEFRKILDGEHAQIFGNASDTPRRVKSTRVELIKKALRTDGSKKLGGHYLFGEHMRDIYLEKKTPTDDDIKIVIAALKDDRVNDWFHLSRFLRLVRIKRKHIPDELIQELANRILRTKSAETARAIRFLSKGAAAGIFRQLERISEDEDLRSKAYAAIIRLGDGGKKAIPKYRDILKEYQTTLLEKEKTAAIRRKLEKLGKAASGALIGLCRLGKDALTVKDMLFSLVSEKYPTRMTSMLAIDALVSMGEEAELRRKFRQNESVWKQVKIVIKNKDRYKKRGITLCGRRIV